MKRQGGREVVRALEDEGAPFAFGIPGTHNIELWDALEGSSVEPIVVTDERSAGFLADGVARSSGKVAVVNLVPGAGVTHALSGIAEAFLDGVPLVVLACGIRSDTGHAYQLHAIDQAALLRPVTKAVLRPATGAELYATVRRAFALARAGTPGPVAVEVPADFYFIAQARPDGAAIASGGAEAANAAPIPDATIADAARRIAQARAPLIYAGNGARGAVRELRALAEKLAAPVATTVTGKGVFPERHPLWLWNGLGRSAPPFVREIEQRADLVLAIGCRFSEVATGSYGIKTPEQLIHVDVNPEVFGKNYPAALAVAADARAFLEAILPRVGPSRGDPALESAIARGHQSVVDEREREKSADRVSAPALFGAVQREAPEAIHVVDSGNGLFLAMENLRLDAPGRFLGPVDFSCMGYSVPAAIGAKLANPTSDVVSYTGDGAFLMTGLELLTAARHGAGIVVCLLRDEELGQIGQFQRATSARDDSSELVPYDAATIARAAGAEFLRLERDADVRGVISDALGRARRGSPTIVEVAIDYGPKTHFTRGVVMTNFLRLPAGEKIRKLARLAKRALTGA